MIILPSWLVISPLEPPRQDWGIRVLDSSVPVPTVVGNRNHKLILTCGVKRYSHRAPSS